MGNLQRFIEVEDSSGSETIWTCCITCLGHLAALSHLLGQRVPALGSSMDDLFDLTLIRLRDISREVRVEAYSYFDVLTGVRISVVFLRVSEALTKGAAQISWKRALDTIDVRIGLRSHAESKSLQDLRGVIGKVHADFQANLLGCGPSPILSMAMLIDGRTPDSQYPNLLFHAGREPYGL